MGEKVELLAPAGSRDALRAAVCNGADAVYLGGPDFHARQAASFTEEDLQWALLFAHHHGTRVYVAVNTLLKNREFEDLFGYIDRLCRWQADGIIVQDPGVLACLRAAWPDLPVHASTQMTVHNGPGIRFLSRQGVDTVVLARENTLEEIRALAGMGPRLEVFLHGAQCVCVSGRCLMSSMVGGRSANRGRCTQPCRLPYRLEDSGGRPRGAGQGEYLLSMRDLWGVEDLGDLLQAGVASLKIEGRMKRPSYVATVVRIYRDAIDRWQRGEAPDIGSRDRQELSQVFNRGFTRGWPGGTPMRGLVNWKQPNHRGLFLGRIRSVRDGRLVFAPTAPVHEGDELEIWVTRGGRKTVVVGDLQHPADPGGREAGALVSVPCTETVYPGDRIFRVLDCSLERRAAPPTAGGGPGKIPLQVRARARRDHPLELEFAVPGRPPVRGSTREVAVPARNRPLDAEMLRSKIRLGQTPYELASLEADIEGALMVPLAAVNRLRRELLSRLAPVSPGPVARSAPLPPRPARGPAPTVREIFVETGDARGARAALDAGADGVILHLDPLQGGTPEDPARLRPQGARVWYALPGLVREADVPALRERVRQLAETAGGFLAGNPGTLEILRQEGVGPVYGDYPLNVTNDYAAALFARDGVAGVCLSPELSIAETEGFCSPVPLETVVHGNLPLMLTPYCLPGALLGGPAAAGSGPCPGPCREDRYYLRDRKEYRFPVLCDTRCHMHILNAREICLLREMPRLLAGPVARFRILMRERTPREIARVTAAYCRVRDGLETEAGVAALWETLEGESPYGFTRGHSYREVE